MTSKLLTLFLASSVLFLSACEITITGIDAPPPVSNATYRTNYEATIDGVKTFIICDDETTTLTYEFDYSGNLASWTSYLRGTTTNSVRSKASFTLADAGVNRLDSGRIRVEQPIGRNSSPLSVDLSPQSIVVVPNEPTVVGGARLFLEASGYTQNEELSSSPIPVVDNCF